MNKAISYTVSSLFVLNIFLQSQKQDTAKFSLEQKLSAPYHQQKEINFDFKYKHFNEFYFLGSITQDIKEWIRRYNNIRTYESEYLKTEFNPFKAKIRFIFKF